MEVTRTGVLLENDNVKRMFINKSITGSFNKFIFNKGNR